MYTKDFNTWNEVKKKTDGKKLAKEFFFHEREIWWASLGLNIGVEADGKHDTFERPVLILRVFNKEMLWVIPVTSTIRNSPFHYRFKFNDESRSLMLSQIRTISSKRLIRRIDNLLENDFKNVQALISSFIYKSETPPKGGESRRPKP
jgi:mRNA-degrading endonuclease toxin of MazEF toxin-antitoxin module